MIQFYFRQSPSSNVVSKFKQLFKSLSKNLFRFGLIILLVVFILKNNLSVELNFNTSTPPMTASENIEAFSIFESFNGLFKDENKFKNRTHLAVSGDKNLSNDYSNMTYDGGIKNVSDLATSGVSKIKKQQNYVARFAEVARSEMRKFGIPASITLAQGLIESNAGESRLTVENNNHFGMKCFSKKCKKGHCANFTDDSHKDFFRKYETAWESFRAHSIMLGGDRYKHLKKLKKSDYKGWAYGLKKAGYATDKHYAEKLIHIIEEMELYKYDD